MTALVLAVQVALPLTLLLWLVLSPVGQLLGFILQAAGVGACLFALARVAQWALPIWWLPWIYGGLWLTAIIALGIRVAVHEMPVLPKRLTHWLALSLSLVLLGTGGWYAAQALAGRMLPNVEVVDISNPLGPGHYLVGNGGSNITVNAHVRTLDPSVERFRAWRGQSYAIDFFGLGPWGLRANGWRPAAPENYAIFGASLYAPCDGLVVKSEHLMPDFQVPAMDPINRLGNHVILRCGNVEIVFAHMRNRSLTVATGERVTTGERLGEVGNSGASTEPHLHIHAQRPSDKGAAPLSGEPLALRIEGRFLVRGDHLKGKGL